MSREGSGETTAGFALVEAIVALAIVTLALAALYQGMGVAYRAVARVQLHEAALVQARSHLDSLGADGTMQAGPSSGTYDNGLPWRLSVSALTSKSGLADAGLRPYWVVLEALDRRGATIIKLETAKLARETP